MTPFLGVRRSFILGIGIYTEFIIIISVAELSRRYKEDGMLAYIELVQQKERELGVDILTHQKWYVPLTNSKRTRLICFLRSGANYVDKILQSVSSSSTTSSVGSGSTEHAF